jgi:hypothetical protein
MPPGGKRLPTDLRRERIRGETGKGGKKENKMIAYLVLICVTVPVTAMPSPCGGCVTGTG